MNFIKASHATTSQPKLFTEAARALECDEDEAHFNEALGKIAKQKPTDKPPKPETDKPGQ
jgi:hypothetical protein